MNDIITQETHLPATAEELQKFIEIGDAQIRALQLGLDAIEDIGDASQYYNERLEHGQAIAEIVLDAHVKLGEMCWQATGGKPDHASIKGSVIRGSAKSLPEGITHKESHKAQRLSDNKPIIQDVKDSCLEQKRLATAEEVYKEIVKFLKAEKRRNRKEAIKDKEYPNLINADFRDYLPKLPDNSIDLILTDPPYNKEAIEDLWEPLSAQAKRLLKPHGFLISYSGQHFLKDIFSIVDLNYFWTIAIEHTHGQNAIHGKDIWNSWKPIIIWYKENPLHEWFIDFLSMGSKTTKDHHDWAQPIEQAKYLIERLSVEGGLILDPMCGTGTTLRAAKETKREWIGVEIDNETYLKAQELM